MQYNPMSSNSAAKEETCIQDSNNSCFDFSEQWDETKKKILDAYGDRIYEKWIKNLSFLDFDGKCLYIEIDTEEAKSQVENFYLVGILHIWNQETKSNATKILVSVAKKETILKNVSGIVISQTNEITKYNLEKWTKIKNILRCHYGEAVYDRWIDCLVLESINGSEVVLAAPTKFLRDWSATYYKDSILELWKRCMKEICSLDIVVSNALSNIKIHDKQNYERSEVMLYDEFSSPLEPRYTFETFVIGKSNELAFSAAKRIADSFEPERGKNPLFLYGGVGLGKTHLMHAIAWYIKSHNSSKRVLYLSAEKFMHLYIKALQNKDMLAFKDQMRSVDILMVDDVQFIGGKDSTQEEFFHTFNALIAQNKQLVISADKSPSDLSGVEERVKSRLGGGLVADINETTFELRMGILQARIAQIGRKISHKVLEFIAQKVKSNVRELEGALYKVIAYEDCKGDAITVDDIGSVLCDLVRANNRVVTVDDVQRAVVQYFQIKQSDLHSEKRERRFARPRQIAMFLTKKLTNMSFPEIGRAFGGRDHSTVIYSVKQVEELILVNTEYEQIVKEMINRLKS